MFIDKRGPSSDIISTKGVTESERVSDIACSFTPLLAHQHVPKLTPPPSMSLHLSWEVSRAILSLLGFGGSRNLYSIWPCRSSSGTSDLKLDPPWFGILSAGEARSHGCV